MDSSNDERLDIRISWDVASVDLSAAVAEALDASGFEVLRTSGRGVDARASSEVISGFFGVPLASGHGSATFADPPSLGRLPRSAEVVYRVYFPRRPESFT